jgi:putative membrane protein
MLKITTGALALLCAVAACSPKNPDASATVTGPDTAAATTAPGVADVSTTPAAAPTPDDKTKTFVEKAALTDMFEIEAAKAALERSNSEPIKKFAQMMIDDHTATTQELGPLATAAGVAPPTAMDQDHLNKIDDLRKAKDADFNKKYLDQQEAAHADALDLMKDYAQNGKDTGIQAFATKVSGKVEEHLQQAKALDHSGADSKKKT